MCWRRFSASSGDTASITLASNYQFYFVICRNFIIGMYIAPNATSNYSVITIAGSAPTVVVNNDTVQIQNLGATTHFVLCSANVSVTLS